MTRPWMPLYVADYLADTGHLGTLEHGAYLLLIMHYWQNGKLPTDDAQLARICRMSKSGWATIRETMAGLFDENWHHKRVDQELEKVDELVAKRTAAGKAGASARYSNRNGSRIANAEQTDSITRGNSHPPTPTEGSSSSPSDNSGLFPPDRKKYAFEFGVVKLSKRDLDQWESAFPRVSVRSELTGAEAWLAKEKNWFQAAAGLLAKRQREATKTGPPEQAVGHRSI